MKGYTLTFIIILLLIFLLIPFSGWGEGDLTKQKPIELTAMLGNKNGELRFFPHTLSLQTGKLYRLILSNPSSVKHYFSSDGMSRAFIPDRCRLMQKTASRLPVMPKPVWWAR